MDLSKFNYAAHLRRPWMALIRNLADPGFDCSGAIIGSSFVVTSASCFCAAPGGGGGGGGTPGQKGPSSLQCKGGGK